MITKTVSKEEIKQLYETDYPLWVDINLELLKERVYELVDWENLLEEIHDMGQRHLDACISYLAVILEHMYKLDNWKDLAGGETAGNGWKRSIYNSRDRIEGLFKAYPSLRKKLPQQLNKAWSLSVAELRIWLRENDYNPDSFYIPQECPYTYEEAMNRQF